MSGAGTSRTHAASAAERRATLFTFEIMSILNWSDEPYLIADRLTSNVRCVAEVHADTRVHSRGSGGNSSFLEVACFGTRRHGTTNAGGCICQLELSSLPLFVRRASCAGPWESSMCIAPLRFPLLIEALA
jgi:hypothetical protein